MNQATNSQSIQEQLQEDPVILLYFNFRGKLQPVRSLLCFLNVPFVCVDVDSYDQEREKYSPKIRALLKGRNIRADSLPQLIHEGRDIFQVYPMMMYLIRRFNKEELLGANLQQRAQIQELMTRIIEKQPGTFANTITLSRYVAKMQGNLDAIRKQTYERIMNESSYVKEITQLLTRQADPQFIFGPHLTLPDFFFFQSSFYGVNFFGKLDCKLTCPVHQLLYGIFGSGPQDAHILSYIDVMRKYLQRFESQQFYQKNKTFLQSFKCLCQRMGEDAIIGWRKLWVGDKKYV